MTIDQQKEFCCVVKDMVEEIGREKHRAYIASSNPAPDQCRASTAIGLSLQISEM